MWILMSNIIVVLLTHYYIKTIQGADNYLSRNLKALNNQEKLFLLKDPLRNGRGEFPYAVCGRSHDGSYDTIDCNIDVSSSIDPYDKRGCGPYTFIKTGDTKLWRSLSFEIGVLIDSGTFVLSHEEP
ncbi:hypothetical protein QAD02_000875 [Eretmocerus hayati]|uniref:Uncharacterized protein n=1 Tax=Eretmocerus hayati TaxID=131215 RepID=A0ACC2NFD9_9HYME|nr:hypothetical protein QAD02_000875 [Eretmocerus hayati]